MSIPCRSQAYPEREPSTSELNRIIHEWPVIEAELAITDIEVESANSVSITEFQRRRLRRAQARLTQALARWLRDGHLPPLDEVLAFPRIAGMSSAGQAVA
jgi:hypothetical protein